MKLIFWNSFWLLVIIVSLELISWIILEKDNTTVESHRNCAWHKDLGMWNKPNSAHVARKYCGLNLCYAAKYSYDSNGLRIIDNKKKNYLKSVILFGGSYTFGEGLSRKETWAYKLQSKVKAKFYNYSRPADGPSTMLRHLELGINIPQKEGIALYLFISDHINRVAMNSSYWWLWMTPGYKKIDSNNIVSIGFKANQGTILSKIIQLYKELQSSSFFLQLWNRRISSLSLSESQELFALIVKRSSEIYEKQFVGNFYVVIHPGAYMSPELLNLLYKYHVKVISLAKSNLTIEQEWVCECDSHPSDLSTTHLSNEIYKFLNVEHPDLILRP